MTPIVLLILVGMWTAVLLPPYLRDRNDTRAAGPKSPVGSRINAITRSLGQRDQSGYLPVSGASLGSPQRPGSPLPAGSRHPITHKGAPAAVPDLPQSSAFQIVGRAASEDLSSEELEARYLLAPDDDVDELVLATPPRRTIPPEIRAARAARKRRREVLYTLMAASAMSLLMGIGLGGPALALHLLIDLVLVGYVVMLIRLQKAKAEREIKVAFLPHGGEGASATDLLAQGGAFRPGGAELAKVKSTAFRVVGGRR